MGCPPLCTSVEPMLTVPDWTIGGRCARRWRRRECVSQQRFANQNARPARFATPRMSAGPQLCATSRRIVGKMRCVANFSQWDKRLAVWSQVLLQRRSMSAAQMRIARISKTTNPFVKSSEMRESVSQLHSVFPTAQKRSCAILDISVRPQPRVLLTETVKRGKHVNNTFRITPKPVTKT